MAAQLKVWRLLRTPGMRVRILSNVSSRHFESFSPLHHQAAIADKPASQDAAVRPVSEIPGPMRLPLVGSAFSMLFDKDFDRDKSFSYWKKMIHKYGHVFRFDLPGYGPLVFLAKPEDCETLACVTMDNPIRKGMSSLEKVRKEHIDNYFEKKGGLLTENDEEWKRVRTRVQTPMMKPKNVSSYLPRMDEVTLEFLERIATFQKENGEMPKHFQQELYKWALESVSLVALNLRLGCLEPNLARDSEPMTLIREANNMMDAFAAAEIGPQLWRFFPTPTFIKLRNSQNEFLKVADENIRQTEAQLLAKGSSYSEEDLTLMETLLLTPGLSRKDVVTLILDMLFAGIDTTSHTVAFTLYLLAKNPKCQAKLQEEVDTVLGDYKGPITSKHLGQLSYLKAVVRESLRVFPLPFGTSRMLQADAVLGGYLVPKGFSVFSVNHFMSQDEEVFPRAKEFIPERWLRHRPLGPIHPYAALPFGLGTRMCVGRRIAEQEIYTFLTRAMQRYTVDYKYKVMAYYDRIIATPSEPLRFKFTERRQ